MGEASITQPNATLPTRVIVDLPSLDLDFVEWPSPDESRAGGRSLLDLLGAAASEVVTHEVVPAVLDGQTWSGELVFSPTAADPVTAMTLWVPHRSGDTPVATATVLIGSSTTSNAGRVAPDPLTGLPTRVVLLDRLDLARRRSRRNDDLLAALFVDLDGLKAINDRLGHEEGDAALRRAAVRIRSCLRDGDTVARFGGDEFVVLCESLEDESQAQRVAERILDRLQRDGANPLSASIGIAFDRAGQLTALDLIGRADAAMYRAKDRGGARVEVFDRELQGRIAADEARRRRLIAAIEGPGLATAAQPLFELATGRVIGVELFVRMRSNGGEVIEGGDLLRLARDHSEAVDTAMFGRAIAIARVWRRRFGRRCPRIHVNLSASSLISADFASRAAAALSRHHVTPRLFRFEVDGQDVSPSDVGAMTTLERLRALGAGVVLDGFGDGRAALPMVDLLRPAMVKITSRDASTQPLGGDVIIAAHRAATSLGVPVCVDGIVGPDLLERIVRAGVHAAQGHALAPIGSIDDMQRRLGRVDTIGF